MIQKAPLAVVCAAVVIMGGYDFYAQVAGHQTISAFTWLAITKDPVIAFLSGLICGHLFWPNSASRES